MEREGGYFWWWKEDKITCTADRVLSRWGSCPWTGLKPPFSSWHEYTTLFQEKMYSFNFYNFLNSFLIFCIFCRLIFFCILYYFILRVIYLILCFISVETQQSSYNILFINKLFHAFCNHQYFMFYVSHQMIHVRYMRLLYSWQSLRNWIISCLSMESNLPIRCIAEQPQYTPFILDMCTFKVYVHVHQFFKEFI